MANTQLPPVPGDSPADTPGDASGATPEWRDGKRYLWLLGLLVPLLPFLGWALVEATGLALFWFTGPILVFGIIPVLDFLAGLDRTNPPEDMIEALENDKYYRWITYLYLPIQYASLVWACWLWAYGGLGTVASIGLALTVGTVAGIGINTAHELGHKKEKHERWLAKIALAQSFYGHFYIEHNRGHHVRVATPEDPASSRVGETVYAFLPRTVVGSLQSAWRLEQPRFKRRRKSHWSIRNDVLNAWLMSVVLWGALLTVFGLGVLPYLLVQAFLGIMLLEIVNYLEHYGMRRQRTGPDGTGRYEQVRPSHSWNSNNVATNVLLYHLQRHSDHHANPTRRYQTLRDFEESPVLPTGYAGMIVLALFPPLWRRVMDPRVIAHFGGDITRANIQPSRREKVLARYGRTPTGSGGQEGVAA
ncbi:MAG TPA: alkane 1-monooxygenase [Nocardioidaceae bacterium]|nr:alkane 1-monooxygenase [Nocardioidaceae bacterium]